MSKKLVISERQLELIAKHIENYDAVSDAVNEVVLEEGFKDIALGLLMLAGMNLSGQNQAVAQEALSNPEIVQKIDNVLSDSSSLNSMISRIEKKLPNAGELIQQNADQIKATVNYIADKNKKKTKVSQTTKTSTTMSPSQIRSKLKQGYAISGIEITRDTILPKESVVIIRDTIDYKWSSDNFFVTAKFELNQNAKDSIVKVVSDIKAGGGKIVGANIEASTDKEPIKMGNEKLAELRANSVKDYMVGLDIGDINFNVTTKPNSGPDVYSRTMSSGERAAARVKTAPHRYVKLTLIVVFEEEVEGNETAPQVIERHKVELVKIYTHSAKTIKLKYKGRTRTSCRKIHTNVPGQIKRKIKYDCPQPSN